MNYEEIKALAKEQRTPVTSLIALAAQNDPFYAGTPADKVMGLWFRDLWQDFGFTTGVHIRRMHYTVVSQNPAIKLPNGLPYENTESCWDKLNYAAKMARYLEYVDPAAFVDRRNDEPKVYQDFYTGHEVNINATYVYEPDSDQIALPEMPERPGYSIDSFSSPQRYHLEIWCEKSTMNDILDPLAQRYRATLLYGKGELSITAALEAIRRFERSNKPVRIFYVSDFDPAGQCMPVSMSRKLEYFVDNLGSDLDIKLFPVVLTYEQTKQYTRLLPTPIKDSEKRKDKFEARFGQGAIELDALEALYPRELQNILAREMNRYYDYTLQSRLHTARDRVARLLDRVQQEVYSQHTDEIAAIDDEWNALQAEFEPLKARIAEHMTRRIELWQAIREDLEDAQPEISEDDVPEATYADERSGALYDSERDYLAQNEVYQTHKNSVVA